MIHYLDDFLLLGASGSNEAANALTIATNTFEALRVPVATHKTEGPETSLSFLGILIDTDRFQLCLPPEKLTRIRLLVQMWRSRRSCTKPELKSFVGHLSHAATVLRPGRIFLRPLFALLARTPRPGAFIRLNQPVHADLHWWHCFLQDWNGSFFFPPPRPSIHVFSDASGSFGCGAFTVDHGWFQLQWGLDWRDVGIAVKEMIPVVKQRPYGATPGSSTTCAFTPII